jgi:dTDP-4-dehydrorhamnose 3,5-epimerase
MRLISRPLPGMLVLQAEPRVDQRGYFARCFCRTELAQWGVTAPIEQANLSFSERALTLRGLHYQVGPSAETKVVTCLQGSLQRRGPRSAGGFADLRRARRRGALRQQ